MHKKPFAGKLAVLSIGMLGLAASFTAQAAPVTYGNCASEQGCYTLDAEYGDISGPKQDGMSDPGTTVTLHPNGADIEGGVYGGGFHTYGFDGNLGVQVNGFGYISASTTYSAQYTNTSDVAQNFFFTFDVQEGAIFRDWSDGFAELLLSIRINGVEVARDQTTYTEAWGQPSCTSNDLGPLGGYMECVNSDGEPIWPLYADARNFTLDLGLFDAGESFTLDYSIVATVAANGWAMVYSGDPFAESWTPFSGEFRPANNDGNNNNVPEPSSLALLGLAFAGLGVVRRRQRNRA